MANSVSKQIIYNKKPLLAVILPQLQKDGMHYEVNISGFPRFSMSWSALGRFDADDSTLLLPYELVLAVSDLLESMRMRK